MSGCLYVVATPIGNLNDMVPRAISILQSVDLIAAEDTRHSQKLLQHFDIDTRLLAYHDHSGAADVDRILALLAEGKSVALISDAGTPLISDPGYRLVSVARERGHQVLAIPGACALVAALCVSGLPTDKFMFAGFLPAKQQARQAAIAQAREAEWTTVFYESPHRILNCLDDMLGLLEPDRQVALSREITKRFETSFSGSITELHAFVNGDANQQRGEMVVSVSPRPPLDNNDVSAETIKLLMQLAKELPPKKAAALCAEISGANKKQLYQHILDNKA